VFFNAILNPAQQIRRWVPADLMQASVKVFFCCSNGLETRLMQVTYQAASTVNSASSVFDH
jgi:hypothetical protein